MEKKWWFWVGCLLLTTLIYGWFEMHRQVEAMSEATIEEASRHQLAQRETPAAPVSPPKEYEIAPYG